MDDLDIGKICRVCLEQGPCLSPLFAAEQTGTVDGISLADMIFQCTNHKVSRDDAFPHLICNNCIEKTKNAFNFKKLYEASHHKLTSYLASVNKNVKDHSRPHPYKMTDPKTERIYTTQQCGPFKRVKMENPLTTQPLDETIAKTVLNQTQIKTEIEDYPSSYLEITSEAKECCTANTNDLEENELIIKDEITPDTETAIENSNTSTQMDTDDANAGSSYSYTIIDGRRRNNTPRQHAADEMNAVISEPNSNLMASNAKTYLAVKNMLQDRNQIDREPAISFNAEAEKFYQIRKLTDTTKRIINYQKESELCKGINSGMENRFAAPKGENPGSNLVEDGTNIRQPTMNDILQLLVKMNQDLSGRFLTLEANQRVTIEELAKQNAMMQKTFSTTRPAFNPVTSPDRPKSPQGFTVIDSVEMLDKFEKDLCDVEFFQQTVKLLQNVCGVSGYMKGGDCAYTLVDIFFTRKFLTLCSWSGGSRENNERKIAFKSYTNVFKLFLHLIVLADKDYSNMQCREFFNIILKNSKRRYQSGPFQKTHTRVSKTKRRRPKVTEAVSEG